MISYRIATWNGLALLAVLLVSGCGDSPPSSPPPPDFNLTGDHDVPKGPPFFELLKPSETGLDFTFRNGEEKNHLAILESLGGGVGLIDYNGDGLLDIFCIGGGHFAESREELKKQRKTSTKIFGYPCKLYRNKGNFHFEDVSAQVLKREAPWFFTHGCAVGDYDCDGWPDLVVTGYHDLLLFHNEPVAVGDPTKGRKLVDVSKKSGITKGIDWSSSAAWTDLDGDGYPELYVCNYANWSWKNNPDCNYDGKTPDVCPPKSFSGVRDCLFKNNRDGTFTNVSGDVTRLEEKTGENGKLIMVPSGKGLMPGGKNESKGLGVIVTDFNKDGRPDIYVANDTVDNHLYLNYSKPGSFIFQEAGKGSGAARDGRGSPNGSMGLAIGDYDHSGRPSLFVTNYDGEMQALYHNIEKPGEKGRDPIWYFAYQTAPAGISAVGQNFVAWGTGFLDLDNRGQLDLLFVNGHAIRFPEAQKGSKSQKPILFRNMGNGKFKNYSARGGEYFTTKHRARGMALGDLNNDGLMDMVVLHINQPIAIVKNVSPTKNHWLGIALKPVGNHSPVGAEIILETAEGKQHRFQFGGGSYASAPDQRHVFGLGDQTKFKKLTVIWPNQQKQEWNDLAVDQYHVLAQSTK